MVGLTAWLPVEVAGLIEERNREVREALLERARSGSSADFENLVGELLTAMGFENVTVTDVSGDGGVACSRHLGRRGCGTHPYGGAGKTLE